MTAAEILQQASTTFRERNAVYKNNAAVYGRFAEILFPLGVNLRTAKDHHRFHLLMLAVVKITRYCQQWENGHQDSVRDAIVYLAMLEAYDDYPSGHGQGDNQRNSSAAP